MTPFGPLSPASLPRPLGLSPKGMAAGSARAQNFSVSKLNYKKDIANAKVSMNQITSKSRPALSSITHINDPVKNLYDQDADDRRYDHVRGLAMANRQKREAEASGSVYDTGVKTGGLFKTTGVTGLRRQLIRMRYGKPGAFKNIDSKDRKYFEDLTKKYVKGVSAGTGIGHHARRAMKQQILQDQRKGVIHVEDAKDFYNMIDNLPGVKRGLL